MYASFLSCHFTYFVLNYLINVDNIIFLKIPAQVYESTDCSHTK